MSGECMDFPQTFEEFAERYKITDTEKVYTNGVDLIPIFRVRQWLEHFREVTKNNTDVRQILDRVAKEHPYRVQGNSDTYSDYNQGWTDAVDRLDSMLPDVSETNDVRDLPPVESKIIKCKDCKHKKDHHYEDPGEEPYIKKMNCKFCESYESWHNIHEFDNRRVSKEEKTKHEYTVALVIHSWCPKYRTKRQAGRTVDYRNQGLGYKLNYCPECGRKIRG